MTCLSPASSAERRGRCVSWALIAVIQRFLSGLPGPVADVVAVVFCLQDAKNPVVTRCKHYFCEQCALKHNAKDKTCFACRVCFPARTLLQGMQLAVACRDETSSICSPGVLKPMSTTATDGGDVQHRKGHLATTQGAEGRDCGRAKEAASGANSSRSHVWSLSWQMSTRVAVFRWVVI